MIRTIVTPETQTVTFNVPQYYIGKELEVIAFTTNEGLTSYNKAISKTASFSALSIDTKSFKFDRNEANER